MAASNGVRHGRKSHSGRALRDRGDARRFTAVRPACVGRAWAPAHRHPGHAPAIHGPVRRRADDPVAQCAGRSGDPRREARDRGGARGQRFSEPRDRQAARSLRRRGRAADAGSGSRRAGAGTLRQGTRARRRAGQRLFPGRRSGHRRSTTTCRSTGRSGPGRDASACRSTFIRATRCPSWVQKLRGPPLADGADLGLRGGDGRARAAADRQRTVRRASAPHDHPRASRRRDCRTTCGASTTATTG